MAFELITSLFNDPVAISTFSSIVTLFGTAIINRIFLRGNTKSEEFVKLQAGKFQEVANDLIDKKEISLTEYYKMNNFAEIAKKADEINTTKEIKPENADKYDIDWFVRFYDNVGNVSNKDMQYLWAKILSDEINNPGSVSYRTIDALKSIDKNTALLFKKICRASIRLNNDKYLPSDDDYLKNCNISYDNVLKLGEYGLLNSTSFVYEEIKVYRNRSAAIIGDNKVLIFKYDEGEKKIHFGVYPFTDVGVYLSQIQDDFSKDANLFCIKDYFKNQDPQIQCSIHAIQEYTGNGIRYDNKEILQKDEKQEC